MATNGNLPPNNNVNSTTEYFNNYCLDIDMQGYWEDYIPLTYFAQYVQDEKNSPYYDLDLIQFNSLI